MDVSAVISSCTLSEARFLLDHFMSMAINKVSNSVVQTHFSKQQEIYQHLSPPKNRVRAMFNLKNKIDRAV